MYRIILHDESDSGIPKGGRWNKERQTGYTERERDGVSIFHIDSTDTISKEGKKDLKFAIVWKERLGKGKGKFYRPRSSSS